MSSVIVVAPVIIASWPVITAAVTAAIGAVGFSLAKASEGIVAQTTKNRAEIEVEEAEILQSAAGVEQKLVVERDGVRATFSRDARGSLKLCMEGVLSKRELRELGEQLMGRVTQQYVYHRIMSELQERNMTVVEEELTENQAVKIRVRNFQ